MTCKVCLDNVKKNAVICASCSLISHAKCADNAPPTCDLRSQLLLYAEYAEKGKPGGAYSTAVDPVKSGARQIPTSPTSEVAYVAPSPSSKASVDYPRAQSPPTHNSPGRPPTAFKFVAAAFKTKRSRASLTPEPPQGSSSSLLPAANDQLNINNVHRRSEKTVTRKPSVLRRNRETVRQPRPHSLSSSNSSTSPNSTSLRSAAESISLARRSVISASETDAGATRSPLSMNGDTQAVRRPNLASLTAVPTAPADDDDASPAIPGSMPVDHQHQKKKSDNNCAIQ